MSNNSRDKFSEGAEIGHDLAEFDRAFFRTGVKLLAGVDEAGRGPLAGPVCAAAVMFGPETFVEGVNDSKKLSATRRVALYDKIVSSALGWSVGWADPCEIDELNILGATKLAMLRALQQLNMRPDVVLIDYLHLEKWPLPQKSLVKGDARSHAIAAASIIAKVERDRLMVYYDEEFPGYGFAKHKGYPTREHTEALKRLGLTTIHRRSFLGDDLFLTGMRKSRTYFEVRKLLENGQMEWRSQEFQRRVSRLPVVERQELTALSRLRG